MRLPPQPPVEKIDLKVGDEILMDERTWWRVQAVSEHFVALVQQVPFQKKGVLRYCVIDWRNGVRGPCNLIGQGYGDGSYSREECAEMLGAFEGREAEQEYEERMRAEGRTSWPCYEPMVLEVSHRNRVPINVRRWIAA